MKSKLAPAVLMHDITERQINNFVMHPRHGLLLYGESGVGLLTLAKHVASRLSDELVEIVSPIDDKDITIEQVRQLYSKTHSARSAPLVVIIDEADNMSHPAQNAFLKLLEEPPNLVFFILTAHRAHLLLDTIHSRVVSIEVRQLDQAKSKDYISQLTSDEEERQQLLFLASGLPAELARLAQTGEGLKSVRELVLDAREFVSGDAYDRLKISAKYSKDRTNAIKLVSMVGKLLKHSSKRQTELLSKLDPVASVMDRLHENSNVRLQLLRLSLLL